MGNLFQASRQWAVRPDDERAATLEELDEMCFNYHRQAAESQAVWNQLRAEPYGEEVAIVSPSGNRSLTTHYAFGQLCSRTHAPASYLRQLPAPLAAQCLQHGLKDRGEDRAALLFHRNNGDLVLRSAMTDEYARVWNYEITGRLLRFVGENPGWKVPPARPAFLGQRGSRPATEADVLHASSFGLSVKVGDLIAPAGLYASDHDLFVFMVNEDRRIRDGSDGGLSRGFFVWNSEVGSTSIGWMSFLYRHCCGNHIVWGAEQVHECRFRHVGEVKTKFFRFFQEAEQEVRKYSDASAGEDESRIEWAKRFELGVKREEVAEALLRLRVPEFTRKAINAAYDLVEQHPEDGSPKTVWGMANGFTRLAQQTPYADERVAMDRAAGQVLKIAF